MPSPLFEQGSLPDLDLAGMVEHARAAGPQLQPSDRALLSRVLDACFDGALARRSDHPRLLHGDFHAGNMVFGVQHQTMSGLWDFSCVESGDPSSDLRYLVADSISLTAEVAAAYEALTGFAMDLRTARLIRLLEEIGDAVEERRPVAAVLTGLDDLGL